MIESGWAEALVGKKAIADVEWAELADGTQRLRLLRLKPYVKKAKPAAATAALQSRMTRSDAEGCVRLTHLHLPAQQGVRAGKVHEPEHFSSLPQGTRGRVQKATDGVARGDRPGVPESDADLVSDWLLVEVASDLDDLPDEPHRTTRPSVFRGIRRVPGVVRVVDIDCISRETLDRWLLPADQTYEYEESRKRRRGRKAS